MANLIPLNYFNRTIATVSATPFAFYTTPYNRAGIIIAALATNLTSTSQIVTDGLSSSTPGVSNTGTYYTIVSGFQLQPNDTANLVINKLILNQYDSFIVSTPNARAVNLNVSVLETANTISTTTPLNYFKRVSQAVTTTTKPIYTAPYNVAGIIITALASNLTNQNQTVTVSVSTAGTPNSNFVYASNFIVPPNDTANLVNYNKLVLNTNDTFIISAANNNALNITMSILETVNTQ
jgi:hypothetical protein